MLFPDERSSKSTGTQPYRADRSISCLADLRLSGYPADPADKLRSLCRVQNAFPGCPLGIGIDVHFHYAVAYGVFDFLSSRTGTTVEYEVQAVVRQVVFLRNIFLRITQYGFCSYGSVTALLIRDVIEGRCTGAIRLIGELGVCVINVFRLGVQCRSVHVAVVHAVFFTTGATQFTSESCRFWTYAPGI